MVGGVGVRHGRTIVRRHRRRQRGCTPARVADSLARITRKPLAVVLSATTLAAALAAGLAAAPRGENGAAPAGELPMDATAATALINQRATRLFSQVVQRDRESGPDQVVGDADYAALVADFERTMAARDALERRAVDLALAGVAPESTTRPAVAPTPGAGTTRPAAE